MNIATPALLALIIPLVVLVFWNKGRTQILSHSSLSIHQNLAIPIIGRLPKLLLAGGVILLVIGLARPQLPYLKTNEQLSAVDIIISVDVSGSMFSGRLPPGQQELVDSQGGTDSENVTYIHAAQAAIRYFLSQHACNRVGLMIFSDDTRLHWPLSTDCGMILTKVELLDDKSGGGTNMDGPVGSTKMGALQSAINHFLEFSGAESKVLILVTDGEDDFDPQRFEELKAQFEELNIHLYVLGVGTSWTSGKELDLRTFANEVGGEVIEVGDNAQMQAAFAEIAVMHPSNIEIESITKQKDIYFLFVIAGIVSLLLAAISSALIISEEN